VQPTLVRYEAPGWGIGEVWLDAGRVVWSEHPRPRPTERPAKRPAHPLAERLAAFFEGEPDDFLDVELDFEDGFYGDCQRVLRAVPRGEIVTYGELAALAGRPGAARAAGTFCARNRLGVLVPCHRVVAATGIGSFGELGVAYKRRMLALEGVDAAL
jgi:methylated-DNA-[protein]-cysteine S-methyltransferase